MKKTAFSSFGRPLVVVTAALASACAGGAPVTPPDATTSPRSVAAVAGVSDGNRRPDLTGCENLAAPEGSTLVLHAFGDRRADLPLEWHELGLRRAVGNVVRRRGRPRASRHSLRRSDVAEQQWWQGGRHRRQPLHSGCGVDPVALAHRSFRWSRHLREGDVHPAAEHRRRQRAFHARERRR